MPETSPPIMFEAVIVPHRSLSRRGLLTVIAALCCLSMLITTLFWYLGAWPVAGFNGAELLLGILLLRHNARGSRASEVLLLSEQGLRIIRTDMRGVRSEAMLPATWLRVQLIEQPGRIPALLLSASGRRTEVAASLGEAEKRDLAAALSEALHRWRNPRFDNPQLRDD